MAFFYTFLAITAALVVVLFHQVGKMMNAVADFYDQTHETL